MAFVIAQRSIPGLAVVLFVAAFFCGSIWGSLHAPGSAGARQGTGHGVRLPHQHQLRRLLGPTAIGWVRDLTGSFSARVRARGDARRPAAYTAATPSTSSRKSGWNRLLTTIRVLAGSSP